MEFKSQICTNVIQSQRLIELGLREETADMANTKEFAYDPLALGFLMGDSCVTSTIDYLHGGAHRERVIAWSLHRLIEMIGDSDIKGYEISPSGIYLIYKEHHLKYF